MVTTVLGSRGTASNTETAESGTGGGCEALLEVARPDIYRRNAFRVAGLSVEATPRDVSTHAEELRVMQKYGGNRVRKTLLPLVPAPDDYAIGEALHRLRDPEKRMVDEFFWFWPHQLGQGRTDEVLTVLASEGADRAAQRWVQLEQSSEGLASMHNLAVLFHCLALDWEQMALTRKLSSQEQDLLKAYWDHAFRRWKVVLHEEPVWSRLTARIRTLEDPRLTTGLSRRMRTSLPLSLLSINAALAVRYAEAGDMQNAKRQVEIMKRWEDEKAGAPGPLLEQALRDALEPIRRRIKSICKNAEEQADRDPEHGECPAREVILNTGLLRDVIDGLLPKGNPMRDAAHDEVAIGTLLCVIPYANKTENWKIVLEILRQALPIAAGQTAHDRIQENITAAENNLRSSMCWFCQENTADEKCALSLKMFGNVKHTAIQVTWQHTTVEVPRCARCKGVHSRTQMKGGFGCLGVVIALAIAIGLGAGGVVSGGWALGIAVLLGFVLIVAGVQMGEVFDKKRMPTNVRPETAKSDYPRVKELLGEGWSFGEKPST